MINGEFAFVLYDSKIDATFVARDPLGIRSLYWVPNGSFITSEMKAIPTIIDEVEQFPNGSYATIGKRAVKVNEYYDFTFSINNTLKYNDFLVQIRDVFEECVHERLMGDRSIGCILSGGLDSTLVTAVVARKLGGRNLNTYTIGLEGGVDLKYARMASEYLQTKHHEFVVTEKEFLDGIEETIYQIESWDVTSVRASTCNFLVCKKIKELGEDAVIFCGDVSDEIFASYRGFQNAPNEEEFLKENIKMLKNIKYFDVLRSDKSISGAGLEGRVPFGDQKFVDLVMSIPPKYKMFSKDKIEKKILREAFIGYLPDELLYRIKCAFSDSVSKQDRSWSEILKNHINTKVTDAECSGDKESYYYRKIFNKYYPGREHTIPYQWLHPFCPGQTDPSARTLDIHQE